MSDLHLFRDRFGGQGSPRYDEGGPRSAIPYRQRLTFACRGEEKPRTRVIRGKYFFHFDEGFLRIVDPHGFGTVEMIERGLIGRIEIAVEEAGG